MGGGLFLVKMFGVGHRQGKGGGGLMECLNKGIGEGGFMVG